MRFFLALALMIQAANSFGVDFTKLSRAEPVSTVYPATFKCYVDVSLFVNATDVYEKPVFLRVSYIISNDTLNDNIEVKGSFNNVVKQLFLDEGERLTVAVQLNNGDIEVLDGMEGSLRVVRNPDFQPTDDLGKSTFLSGVWKSDQTPLFRIPISDSIPQFFRLKMDFNQNYEYDKFYFKMKVISPKDGIIMLDKSIDVNENAAIDLRTRSYSLDIKEIDMTQPGTYYFQVMSNMSAARVNGINKITYEIVSE